MSEGINLGGGNNGRKKLQPSHKTKSVCQLYVSQRVLLDIIMIRECVWMKEETSKPHRNKSREEAESLDTARRI